MRIEKAQIVLVVTIESFLLLNCIRHQKANVVASAVNRDS